MGLLGIPAMTLGGFLVVSFYCVLRKKQKRTWIALLVGSIIFGTAVNAAALFPLVKSFDEIDPTWEFWLSVAFPSLACSVNCLVVGLLVACFLRLIGYRLWIQNDGDESRQVKPNAS